MWPYGRSFTKVGYGRVGTAFLKDNEVLGPRENSGEILYHAEIKTIADRVSKEITGRPSTQLQAMATKAVAMDAGYIPFNVLKELASEGTNVNGLAVLDPIKGCRVAYSDTDLMYGDGYLLRRVHEDKIVQEFEMPSPILQVSSDLVRTYSGVSYFNGADTSLQANEIFRGESMHCCFAHKRKVAATLNLKSSVFINNVEGRELTTFKLPRTSRAGWGRLAWTADETRLGIATKRRVILADPRDTSPRDTCSVVVHYPDKLAEVVDFNLNGDNMHILTSSGQLLWYDLRNSRELLSMEHLLHNEDRSSRIALGTFKDSQIIALYTQLQAFNTIYSTRLSESGPVSLRDPYIVEYSPNLVVDGEVLVETTQGVDIYMTTTTGGLFKQSLSTSKADEVPALLDEHPTPEIGSNLRDFDQTAEHPVVSLYQMENLYKYIYELKLPQLSLDRDSEHEDANAVRCFGYKSLKEAKELLSRIWLGGPNEKSRLVCIEEMLETIASVPIDYDPTIPVSTRKIPEETKEILGQWVEDPEATQDPVPTQDTQDSQPTQDTQAIQSTQDTQDYGPDMQMTQVMLSQEEEPLSQEISFSQPLPRLSRLSQMDAKRTKSSAHKPNKKLKTKHKRPKEGF